MIKDFIGVVDEDILLNVIKGISHLSVMKIAS